MSTRMKNNEIESTSQAEFAPRHSLAAVWSANIGLLLIAIATMLPIFRLATSWFRWIYAAGALLTLIGRLCSLGAYKGMSLRVRRLGRMELWTAIMFCVGAFFAFYPGAGPTDWLAFTLAGAVLQGYSSIMIGRALKAGK